MRVMRRAGRDALGVSMADLNILFPVYNEEKRLEPGIRKTVEHLDGVSGLDYELTIVDNASSDGTQRIAEELCQELPQVRYIRLEQKGVGAAFRAGAAENQAPIVGYMDVDLSTDLKHLDDMLAAFQDTRVGMVNGSRLAKGSDTQGRKWYRNITSRGLTFVIRAAIGMEATDSICGFKFFRKELVDELVSLSDQSDNGWSFIIELLLRAERSGWQVHELPVHWEDETEDSKVDVIPQIMNYLRQIRRIRKRLR